MIKILRKSFRKRIAILLLAVMLIPLVPVLPVSADVTVPDFPYLSQSWYDTNTYSFALWEVHGSDNVSFVQTRTNVFSSGAFPVVYRSGLSWTGYYYYIDYSKIIDTWDKDGNHIDSGYSWSQNIRVPVPNETTVDSEVYATLVYCSTDIYHGNGAGDDDIYAYQNFIVPSYTDPTPTPTPEPEEPELDTKFPTFINANAVNYAGTENRATNLYLVCSRYYDEPNTRYEYQYEVIPFREMRGVDWKWHTTCMPRFDGYDFVDNTLTYYFVNTATYANYDCKYGGSFFTSSNYKTEADIYDVNHYSTNMSATMEEYMERSYKFSVSEPTMNYEATAIYSINTSDGTCTRIEGDGESEPTPTPTPTAVPTAIPQPSSTPMPTEPPDSGEDNNWTGLFGWLKRIRDSILSIPKKIATGLLDALKYIFIPDMDRVKSLYADLDNKVGIVHPPKFEFTINDLRRPNNVYYDFHPISVNGETAEPIRVTIIDFEAVDEWLDSDESEMFRSIIKACFGLLIWGYMIYVFTKHIGSINYTDAQRLEGVYKRSNEVGGDETDV